MRGGRAARLAATVGGVGRLPAAPGTWGSLAGLAALAPLASRPPALWTAVAALTALGVWSAGATARALGRRDPPCVVIDEVAGMGLTLALAPGGGPGWWLAAFAAFRFFDVLKPWPLRRLERLPGGVGIVADDLGAALAAALLLRALRAVLAR